MTLIDRIVLVSLLWNIHLTEEQLADKTPDKIQDKYKTISCEKPARVSQ